MTKIEKAQMIDNVKFETAKKIAALLDEAKAEYKKLGGASDDWDAELETIQTLVFEDD